MENQAGYESYVVVHNIAKRHNVGTLAGSANAFGVSELIPVDRRDFNTFGSHDSTSHLRFRHFHSLSDARLFLKDRDCDICGVECCGTGKRRAEMKELRLCLFEEIR